HGGRRDVGRLQIPYLARLNGLVAFRFVDRSVDRHEPVAVTRHPVCDLGVIVPEQLDWREATSRLERDQKDPSLTRRDEPPAVGRKIQLRPQRSLTRVVEQLRALLPGAEVEQVNAAFVAYAEP